jgi:general secretion pathway protein D
VVDSNTNTLIFNTNAENYSQLISLLNTLDQPSKSALIEVTVAEVRLTDTYAGYRMVAQRVWREWHSDDDWHNRRLGTRNSRVDATRLASGGDVPDERSCNVESSDNFIESRVVARNGEVARIQVGQVPIITSQQSTLSGTTGDSAGVLQTIQYRNTGVILSIRPSIFSGIESIWMSSKKSVLR